MFLFCFPFCSSPIRFQFCSLSLSVCSFYNNIYKCSLSFRISFSFCYYYISFIRISFCPMLSHPFHVVFLFCFVFCFARLFVIAFCFTLFIFYWSEMEKLCIKPQNRQFVKYVNVKLINILSHSHRIIPLYLYVYNDGENWLKENSLVFDLFLGLIVVVVFI